MKIHHIGYLVRDVEKTAEQMRKLGFRSVTRTVYDPLRDVDIQFLESSEHTIELVSPKSEKSVVWKQLKKSGVSPYHMCFSVSDIDQHISMIVQEEGYVTLQPPLEAPAIANAKVAFLYNPDIGIIELIEEEH